MASTSRENPPSSESSPTETPTINNSFLLSSSRCMANSDSIEEIIESSDSEEAPPSNFQLSLPNRMASTSRDAPPSTSSKTSTIKICTKTKSKFSIRSLVPNFNFKALFCFSKSKPLESIIQGDASSSTTTNKNDDHVGTISLSSKMIRNDLDLVDAALKKHVEHVNVKIKEAYEKIEKLQTPSSSQRDFDELRKDVAKLKLQIPSQVKINYAYSNSHRKQWPNINEAEDGMTHFFYKEPKVALTGDFDRRILEDFHHLPTRFQHCLMCFFKFPPEVTIKRTTIIYLWIGQEIVTGPISFEVEGLLIFHVLIEKGFIEPVYQNCSLVPDSCSMSLSVRSSLYEQAESRGCITNTLDLDLGFVCGAPEQYSCLINVGEAIIDFEPKIFENNKHITSLYLGRWQSLATHHIELAYAKILEGVMKLSKLRFLSLRGISMITELPTIIFELNDLMILDLRACHNLEVIPDEIGWLQSLTHLDMSECYFLEHMPKTLANLLNLRVLKGFLIGDFDNNKPSCTISDLSALLLLKKLNIYVSVKDFCRLWDFNSLKHLRALKKLTISWGGCSLQGESRRQIGEEARKELLKQGPFTLPPKLQKLDLQGFPTEGLTDWLRPVNTEGLKKLYIRGGQLCDLGQREEHQAEQWTVEILRLKYLTELEIDWWELRRLFPNLMYLHQVGCPKLTNFPCDERGVWTDNNAIELTLLTRIEESSFWRDIKELYSIRAGSRLREVHYWYDVEPYYKHADFGNA